MLRSMQPRRYDLNRLLTQYSDNVIRLSAGEGMFLQKKISYLISQYPAISHTFILREVLHLKKMGLDLISASINQSQRERSRLTTEEQLEQDVTYYVKQAGVLGALKSLCGLLFRRPLSLFKAEAYAVKMAGLDLRKQFYHQLYFIEALMVANWMDANDSDRLHVHFASSVATVGIFVKKINNCFLSITVHGPDEFYLTGQHLLEEKIKVADKLFCISDFARSQLMKLSDFEHWNKFQICRLGVDTEKFKRLDRVENECPKVLSVGRLCPAKGQHLLVQAARTLADRNLEFKLVIVGDGPDADSLKALSSKLDVNDYIDFVGSVNHDEVQDYYSACDVFCLPSFAEGIPIVLMEAMAKEIPCVTSRIVGIPELIDDQIDGLLTPPSNIEALANALELLLRDKELREALGKQARKKVNDKYHLEKNMTFYGEKFKEYVAESSK